MKLRKKVLYHPGNKRCLAEDLGQDTPWGISTHRENRKSGSRWILRLTASRMVGDGKLGGTAYRHLCVQQKKLE